MTWNYRVLHTKVESMDFFEIVEMYYDAGDRFRNHTEACIYGETLEELKSTYEMMKEAFEKPVVSYEDGNLH